MADTPTIQMNSYHDSHMHTLKAEISEMKSN